MNYDQLGGWKNHVLNQYAPKVRTILNNKFPGCDVEWEGDKPSM